MSSPTDDHRLVLRPGVTVMAREPGLLQVGLDAPSVRLADQADVRHLLNALRHSDGLPMPYDDLDPSASSALSALHRAGLVLARPVGEEPDGALRVLRAQFGADAERRRAARSAARIAVHADPQAERLLLPLLEGAGLATAPQEDLDATAHLVVAPGAVDRARLDPLVQGSVPHLVLGGDARKRRIGPFVDPGRTACLRCVDAHESVADIRRPLLLAQAAAAATERPSPQDPLIDQVALAWAVRDLARYAEGDQPDTWSSTIDLRAAGGPEIVAWGRHPECGCAWDMFIDLP